MKCEEVVSFVHVNLLNAVFVDTICLIVSLPMLKMVLDSVRLRGCSETDKSVLLLVSNCSHATDQARPASGLPRAFS